MANVASSTLDTVGLGGDGDEIAAIAEVERQFGVRLDYSHAREWRTVGDVFKALQQSLPVGLGEGEAVWRRFAEAISRETGVDPENVATSTRLIGKPFPYRHLWLIGAVAGLAAVAFKMLV